MTAKNEKVSLADELARLRADDAGIREHGRQEGYEQAERDIVAYFESQAEATDPESLEWRVLYGVFSLVAAAVQRKKHRKGEG